MYEGTKVEVPKTIDEETAIQLARTVKGITEQVQCFVHLYEEQKVKCECGAEFGFKEEEDDFSDTNLPRNFRNLKRSLLIHLSTEKHKKKVKATQKQKEEEVKVELRSRKIDKTIGGLIYILLKNGRPDGDLPLLIHRVKQAGGDVGDVNHSKGLVGHVLPEIAAAVEGRLRTMLGTRMVATGQLPPINIMADKATDKR